MTKPEEAQAASVATALGDLFKRALCFAVDAHDGDTRKATTAPYASHPLQVAGIALEYGADEEEAAAALLHDVIEDTAITRAEVARAFGDRIARIVEGCSDSDGPRGRAPWRERKEGYVAHLATADASTALVSCADKLHNATCILRDYRRVGEAVWDRFSAGRGEILWYYGALVAAFGHTDAPPDLVADLARTVEDLRTLVADAGA